LDAELAEARSFLGELEGRIAAAADRLREIGAQERASSLERDIAQANQDERTRRAEALALERRNLEERRSTLRTEEVAVRAELETTEGELSSNEDVARAATERKTSAMTTQASLEERMRGIARSRAEANDERAQAEQGPTDPE